MSIQAEKFSDLIYDVGMHKGEDSEFYLNKGFRVVAFEADPEHVAFVKNRLSSFIDAGRLVIVEGAIVDDCILESGQKKISFFKSEASICGTVHQKWVDRNNIGGIGAYEIEVDILDFSSCLKKYGIPYYLKVDIEGNDLACLSSLRDFSQRPDYLSIEAEQSSFEKLVEEISLFESLGYHAFKVVQQSQRFMKITPPFPPREGEYFPTSFSKDSSGLFGRELPGTWLNREQTLQKYRRIIFLYKVMGHYGLCKSWFGKRIHGVLKRLLRHPLPGWFDTHAIHSSVFKA